jgi:hypothetical protein
VSRWLGRRPCTHGLPAGRAKDRCSHRDQRGSSKSPGAGTSDDRKPIAQGPQNPVELRLAGRAAHRLSGGAGEDELEHISWARLLPPRCGGSSGCGSTPT